MSATVLTFDLNCSARQKSEVVAAAWRVKTTSIFHAITSNQTKAVAKSEELISSLSLLVCTERLAEC